MSTATPATAEETVTLLTLVQLLRSRSAPLNELLTIAKDPEPVAAASLSLGEYVALHESEAQYQPSVCRRAAPIYQPDISVSDADVENYLDGHPWPPAVIDMLDNQGSQQRRGGRSPDWAPDIIDPDPWQPEPTPSFNDDGSRDSKSPKYSWPWWYKMTAKGAQRWKFDP